MSSLPAGHSGYFASPSSQLDPSLFDGLHLKHDVRVWLVLTLEAGLRRYLDIRGADVWLHAWLAGSGITYQWDANRGNGDLDVLFGVDMPVFVEYNPRYAGLPESAVADHADQVLKEKMWPKTAHQRFGQQHYEVTFFWNPGTGRDITSIHPYAAYDLKSDAWVVVPPTLPRDPRALYSGEWFHAADRDVDAAETLARRHDSLSQQLGSTSGPAARNIEVQLAMVREQARALFDEIHSGRREAFGEQGHGYSDWHNFRWQSAKQNGIVEGLKVIIDKAKADDDSHAQSLYGGAIDGPDQILTRAMLDRGNNPYLR
jgi:hypothetical protein